MSTEPCAATAETSSSGVRSAIERTAARPSATGAWHRIFIGPPGSFTPATLILATGSKLTVKNEGQAPHTFTITGQSVDVTLNPGTTQTVSIDLPAGTYPFVCTFHQSQGMKGTLTVSG